MEKEGVAIGFLIRRFCLDYRDGLFKKGRMAARWYIAGIKGISLGLRRAIQGDKERRYTFALRRKGKRELNRK